VYAWQFARNARIADAAYLHFAIISQYQMFYETFSAPFSLDHSSGALISLIGDNPNSVYLEFPTSNGLVVDSGHSFSTISNVTIQGPTATDAGGPRGITATSGATIASITQTTITQCGIALYTDQNSSVSLGSNVEISQCYSAMSADHGASIMANGSGFQLSSTSAQLCSPTITLRLPTNPPIFRIQDLSQG